MLAHEVGVNSYRSVSGFDAAVAEDYWRATRDFWAGIRAEWQNVADSHDLFGLTIQGEPEELYMPILDLAHRVEESELATAAAVDRAQAVIASYVATDGRCLSSLKGCDSAPGD